MKYKIFFLTFLVLLGCSNKPKIVFKNKMYKEVSWTEEEKEKNIAVRHLRSSKYSSSHLIRIKGAEQPHYHDKHDLSVTVMSGTSILHFKSHKVVLKKGDTVTIGKGTYHWLKT